MSSCRAKEWRVLKGEGHVFSLSDNARLIYHVMRDGTACNGCLPNEQQAQRLADMYNDLGLVVGNVVNYQDADDKTNYRICETLKLFCMQEGLTFYDVGLSDENIRVLNRILEMKIDLHQREEA